VGALVGGIMARQINRLSAIKVQKETKIGLHPDGGGLYLRVTASGGKFWVFRYMHTSKAREMGLGAIHAVSLSEARIRSVECRKLLSDGIDPIKAREEGQALIRLEAAKSKTFKECAESYIKAHEPAWRNEKHKWQWKNTLERFAYPIFSDLPVQEINVAIVLKVLEPIWTTKTETATRLRGRIELILDWATTREYRKGENPARWRGHLQNLLPRPSKIQKVKHQPSLPYEEISSFLSALQMQPGNAAKAMAFTIFTASRTSEVLGLTWEEIDMKKRIWTIPADRTKAGREHKVPLSQPAMDTLQTIQKENSMLKVPYKTVFTAPTGDRPLSKMSMLMVLRRMNRADITVHGFRASFRNWTAEQTHYPREVAEAALAHINADKVEAAYMRSDFFEKRVQMMEAWGRHCFQPKTPDSEDTIVVVENFRKKVPL